MDHTSPGNISSALNELLSSARVQQFVVFLLAVTLMFSKLAGSGLANYDDAFYAVKAKAILATGDWMTMHHNGKPAFENPPFFMWLIAVSYKIFGVNEYAAKFPSALMGVATVLLIYAFGRYLFDQWTAFFSSAILATTNLFTRYASRAMMDVTLSFFVTLALFSLVLALRRDARYFLLWGLSVAVCILIKSVLGFFPAVISVLFILVERQWKVFVTPYLYLGALVAIGIGCSWYVVEYLRFGNDFLAIHFEWLIVKRGVLDAPQPWYEHLSYAKDLLTYYWPWLPVFAWGLWRLGKQVRTNDAAVLLLLWCASYFIVMSAMKARVVWYIMPLFPAAAIISGETLAHVLSERRKISFAKFWLGLTVIAIVLINATPIRLSKERETDVRTLAPYVRHFAGKGCKIVSYRFDYYSLNNALLFYSDHAATPTYNEPVELQRAFASSDTVIAFIDNEELPGVDKVFSTYWLVRQSEGMSLIANHPLEIATVKTW